MRERYLSSLSILRGADDVQRGAVSRPLPHKLSQLPPTPDTLILSLAPRAPSPSPEKPPPDTCANFTHLSPLLRHLLRPPLERLFPRTLIQDDIASDRDPSEPRYIGELDHHIASPPSLGLTLNVPSYQ